jgi:hypothetical protein
MEDTSGTWSETKKKFMESSGNQNGWSKILRRGRTTVFFIGMTVSQVALVVRSMMMIN